KTYFPSAELKRKSDDLSARDKIPFVCLPSEWTDVNPIEWAFLDMLWVGMGVSLGFLYEALEHLVDKIRHSQWDDVIKNSLFKLYEEISDKAREDNGTWLRSIRLAPPAIN